MSQAKTNILTRLKSTPHQEKTPELVNPLSSAKSWNPDTLKQTFIDRCNGNRIEVHLVTEEDWPRQLRSIARKKKLNHWLLGTVQAHCSEAKQSLEQEACRVSVYDTDFKEMKNQLYQEIDASLTLAEAGIAETGTLVLKPDENEPRMMSLVPPVHVVLLSISQLTDSLQSYVDQLDGGLPTNLLFISSPSKTADIQQTLAYGAHGPKELILLLKN